MLVPWRTLRSGWIPSLGFHHNTDKRQGSRTMYMLCTCYYFVQVITCTSGVVWLVSFLLVGVSVVVSAFRSSSVSSVSNISFGMADENKPTLGSLPNNALYGDWSIVLWCDLIFWNWTILSPSDQWELLFSWVQEIIIHLMSAFARSTDPWLWGWRGLPCNSLSSGQSGFNSVMIFAVNLLPLSLYKMCGAPRSRHMSVSWYATSAALFNFNGRNILNFAKWSW